MNIDIPEERHEADSDTDRVPPATADQLPDDETASGEFYDYFTWEHGSIHLENVGDEGLAHLDDVLVFKKSGTHSGSIGVFVGGVPPVGWKWTEWKRPPQGKFSADEKLIIHFVATRGAKWKAGDTVHMFVELKFKISSRPFTVHTNVAGTFAP